MAPPRSRAPIGHARAPPSMFQVVTAELKNPENRQIFKSILIFGAAVAFFSSPMSEMITTGL